VEPGDADLAATALRETTEETGIPGLVIEPGPVDVDVHWVGTHFHYDVRYVVVAPPGATPVGNHESRAFRWITPDELDNIDADARGSQRRQTHSPRTASPCRRHRRRPGRRPGTTAR